MFNEKFRKEGTRLHILTCLLLLLMVGIYLSLHFIPDYATHDGNQGGLHDAHCHSGDSMNCKGRLIGVQVTNGMATGFAFVGFILYMIKFTVVVPAVEAEKTMMDKFYETPPIFWAILLSMSSSITTFFLWASVNSRIYFNEGDSTWSQSNIQDGKMLGLSISGMVVSFAMFLCWISYEVYYDNNRERISAFWVRDVAGRLFSLAPFEKVNKFGEMLVYHGGYGVGPNSITKESFTDNDRDGPILS